jgi:hypothetical protein
MRMTIGSPHREVTMVKIFLDDTRVPSDIFGEGADFDWILVCDTEKVKEWLLAGNVSHLSLDNDLGIGIKEGYTIVNWMIENSIWPSEEVFVHSANIIRSKQMREDINRYFYNGIKKEK